MADAFSIASAAVGVAGAGIKLTTTLYTYIEAVRSTDSCLKAIAGDVSATSAVLQELGTVLQHDQPQQLVSDHALETANDALLGCQAAFTEVEQAIAADLASVASGKKALAFGARLAWPLKHQKVKALQANLERLKLTLLLMLQVLLYARSIANDSKTPASDPQVHRAQIEALALRTRATNVPYDNSYYSAWSTGRTVPSAAPTSSSSTEHVPHATQVLAVDTSSTRQPHLSSQSQGEDLPGFTLLEGQLAIVSTLQHCSSAVTLLSTALQDTLRVAEQTPDNVTAVLPPVFSAYRITGFAVEHLRATTVGMKNRPGDVVDTTEVAPSTDRAKFFVRSRRGTVDDYGPSVAPGGLPSDDAWVQTGASVFQNVEPHKPTNESSFRRVLRSSTPQQLESPGMALPNFMGMPGPLSRPSPSQQNYYGERQRHPHSANSFPNGVDDDDLDSPGNSVPIKRARRSDPAKGITYIFDKERQQWRVVPPPVHHRNSGEVYEGDKDLKREHEFAYQAKVPRDAERPRDPRYAGDADVWLYPNYAPDTGPFQASRVAEQEEDLGGLERRAEELEDTRMREAKANRAQLDAEWKASTGLSSNLAFRMRLISNSPSSDSVTAGTKRPRPAHLQVGTRKCVKTGSPIPRAQVRESEGHASVVDDLVKLWTTLET